MPFNVTITVIPTTTNAGSFNIYQFIYDNYGNPQVDPFLLESNVPTSSLIAGYTVIVDDRFYGFRLVNNNDRGLGCDTSFIEKFLVTPTLTPTVTPSVTPPPSVTPSITPSITPPITPSITPSTSIMPVLQLIVQNISINSIFSITDVKIDGNTVTLSNPYPLTGITQGSANVPLIGSVITIYTSGVDVTNPSTININNGLGLYTNCIAVPANTSGSPYTFNSVPINAGFNITISLLEDNDTCIPASPSVTPSMTPSITPSMTPSRSLPPPPSRTPSMTPSRSLPPPPSRTPSITPSITTSPGTPPANLIMTFVTNSRTPDTFHATVDTVSGLLNWDMGDGSWPFNMNSFSYTYGLMHPAYGNKTVTLSKGTTGGASSITQLELPGDGIVGTFNISNLTGLVIFGMSDNHDLLMIINPSSNASIQSYIVRNCNLTGTLDISGLSRLGGNFFVDGNLNLTHINNPTSTRLIRYTAIGCNLTGTLDISGLSGLGDMFNVSWNRSLTTIINPTSNKSFTYFGYIAENCGLLGELDVSGLSGLGGTFKVNGNPGLESIINPISDQLFTDYWAYGCNLTGTLDLSGLLRLAGSIALNENPLLQYVINPTSIGAISYYGIWSCDLRGTLDLSGLLGLGGIFSAADNKYLQGINNPTSTEIFTVYHAWSCGLTGILDLSGLSGLGGEIIIADNINLTQILNPNSSQIINNYNVELCNLTGTLDVSGLLGLGGVFRTRSCANLTTILFPTAFTQPFTEFLVDWCSLNQATVNNILAKLDAWYSSHPPTTDLYLYLNNGANSCPTNGNSNTNLQHLITIFNNNGRTLNWAINPC